MNYKSTMVYVMLRHSYNPDTGVYIDTIPVAVFTDLETAEGNTEGYNLSMQEQGVEGLKFELKTTIMYE
jgi:hypothetical protein